MASSDTEKIARIPKNKIRPSTNWLLLEYYYFQVEFLGAAT
jgi:hypothetical protein